MKKQIKKLLCAAITLAMTAGTIVLPTAASADEYTPLFEGDTVLNEWKFEFGGDGATPDTGCIFVTPDTNFVTNTGDYQYGFLGTGEDDYKLTNRYDGWTTQKGQVIELGTGADGMGIGVVGAGGTGENAGADIFGNKADKYYPTRFALKVEDDTYYRIKAVVTTLDPTKDATASLYTERKHPIYTEKTIKAGETETTEFSVRVTPIYYEKSDPKGTIKDEMVTVGVLGENSALVSLEIQQVETLPTFWVLGDSTVTDGNTTLPFFPLQNYTGVGTGLTKYLPRSIAMVNEGEGGLNAADSLHFNMVSSRIKEGDYLYVEYGHNHKSDGPSGYKACLDKYYNVCNKVGAKLIIVSPIERINQWDSATNTYTHSLRDFATTGAEYVDEKIAAGADDIAYVDLNKYSLDFYNKVTADNNNESGAIKFYFQTAKGSGTDQTHPNDAGAENLAYEFIKAADAVTDPVQRAVLAPVLGGGVVDVTSKTAGDMTVIGASYDENGVLVRGGFSPVSFEAAGTKSVYIPILSDKLMVWDSINGMKPVTEAEASMSNIPNLVSSEITSLGAAGTTSAWPSYIVPTDNKYPVVINDIKVADNGEVTSARVTVQDASTPFSHYGIIVITVLDADGNEKGKIYAVDQVDNSTGKGPQTVTNFTKSVLIGESDTYEAVVLEAEDTAEGIKVKEDGEIYSAVYTPTEIDKQLLLNENGDGNENFDYYGAVYEGSEVSSLENYNGWTSRGSAGKVLTLGQTDEFKYATVNSDGAKNGSANQGSFCIAKDLSEEIGTTGRYIISADIKYVSGGGLVFRLVSGNSDSNAWGTQSFDAFTMGDSGAVTVQGEKAGTISAQEFTKVQYILDMDLGTATMTVGGEDPVTVKVPNYDTTSLEVSPSKLTAFMFGGDKIAFEAKVANLVVAKLKDQKLPEYDVALSASDDAKGTVSLTVKTEEAEPAPAAETTSGTFPINTVLTAKAAANDTFVFMGWLDESGETVSTDSEYTFRLRSQTKLTASFVNEPSVGDITDYSVAAENPSIKSTVGNTTAVKIADAVDSAGTPVSKVTSADVTWSCDEAGITIDAEGVLTIGEGFSLGDALAKEITVKSVLNGIEKTCVITIYGYEYFENMSEASTNFNGTFVNISGTTTIAFPGASTTSTYTMTSPVTLDKATTIEYQNAWTGANTCGQFRTLNFKNSEGNVIFSIPYTWASIKIGDVELVNAIAKDTFTTVTVLVNPETNKVTVSVGGNSTETTLAEGAGDIAAIDFQSASSAPGPEARALGISNITITK